MPTDQHDDDKLLSDLLKQVEPPKSPSHLDEKILRQAREKAESLKAHNETAAMGWFGPGWRSAVAVFSVAAIALSVSIQVINDNSFDDAVVSFESTQAPVAEPPNNSIREEEADAVSFALEQNVALVTSADTAVPTALAELQEVVEQDRTAVSAGGRAADQNQLAQSGTAARVAQSAATLQTPTPERRQARALSASDQTVSPLNTVQDQAGFSDADITARDPLLQLLSSVLLDAAAQEESLNDVGNVSEPERSTLIETLIAAYDELDSDPEAINQLESQYSEQRSLLSDESLPDTAAAAINTLR